ncbi:MAG TPA: glycosyltransferase family 2 protein [Steroidobacteraceae bacterium]|nr:glycosyltransferase family 2 protein [Steroidobacteraceae bacterium]
MPVSVLILTLNEESNIDACIDSVSWSDDVVVLDSLSADATCRIAEARSARVVKRRFDNWSAHQNWAVSHIEFRNPWVLYLDADERCPLDLQQEVLKRAVATAPDAAFRIRRKDFFMGRWLKHAQLYPSWFVRLFRPDRIRYERLVNPVAMVDGTIGDLRAHLIHYPFSHGVSHWIERHNRYSDMEAIEAAKVHAGLQGHAVDASLWSRDPNMRRRALKDLFFRLPARPLVKFLYYYAWRRGFLDGRAGLTYATLQAIYEYMITCKGVELDRRRRGLPV